MRTIRSLVGATLLACTALSHAENAYYPDSLEQSAGVTLNMPVGTATVTLPDAVGAAYLRDPVHSTWSTQYRTSSTSFIVLDGTPGDAYDNAGAPPTLATYVAGGNSRSWFAVVEARHQARAAVELRVGRDLNGDGLPQGNEELCRIRAGLYDTPRCLLDLRNQPDHALWAFAHITGPFEDFGFAVGDFVTVSIATADFKTNGSQVSVASSADITTTRGAGSNDAPVRVNVSYGPSPTQAATEPFQAIGGLLINSSDQNSPTLFPLRLNITPTVQGGQGHAFAARYDTFDEVLVNLQPGEANYGLYVDNPGQDVLELALLNPAAQVLVWQEGFPAASPDSRTNTAPPPADQSGFLVGASAPSSTNYLRVCEGCTADQRIVAGRIRLVVRNMNPYAPISAPVRLRLSRSVDFATRPPPGLSAPAGNYYNPLRSGDGVFLDYVDRLLVFYWYTFDQNGQPVWYTAAAEPSYDNGAVGTINTTLYRITQQAERSTTPVGRIVLTAADALSRELMFSWSIDGDSGTNRLQWAYAPRCTQQAPSTQLNLTGHWFNLSAPGWGTNLLGLRNGIAEGLYFFDASGAPRWVFGALAQNGNAWSGALHQFKGACPTCTYVAPTLTAVGNASLTFSGDSDGSATYSVNLAAPLSGAFVQSAAPMHRATSAVECSNAP